MRRLLPAVFIAASLTLAACGSDDGGVADSPAPAAVATTPPQESTPPEATESTPDAADTKESKGKQGVCTDVPPATPKTLDQPKPTGSLSASKTFVVTMKTSCGSFEITLDQKDNPKTANSFAKLADSGFYDGLGFHRIVPNFVIQGGDPAGNGQGGPDWSVVEAPKSDETYPVGTVAMAKLGTEAPGTSGSQFFVMTGGQLPPEYAVAGRVTKGLDAVEAIAELGTPNEQPSKPAVIEKASLSER